MKRFMDGPLKSKLKRLSQTRDGFTLVEMLIVIALIAIIGAVALPQVSNTMKISLDSITRELATTVKEAYNASAVTGKVYRLAYDLDEKQYWVESGPATALLDTEESLERDAEIQRITGSDAPPPSSFSLDSAITKKKQKLPGGVSFKDILTQRDEEAITEGTVYTHFFPHGVTEQTIIHIQDDQDHEITLVITAIIGQTRLIKGYAPREEVFQDGNF